MSISVSFCTDLLSCSIIEVQISKLDSSTINMVALEKDKSGWTLQNKNKNEQWYVIYLLSDHRIIKNKFNTFQTLHLGDSMEYEKYKDFIDYLNLYCHWKSWDLINQFNPPHIFLHVPRWGHGLFLCNQSLRWLFV